MGRSSVWGGLAHAAPAVGLDRAGGQFREGARKGEGNERGRRAREGNNNLIFA